MWSMIWWRGSCVPSISSWNTNSRRGSISPRRAFRSHSSRRRCASTSSDIMIRRFIHKNKRRPRENWRAGVFFFFFFSPPFAPPRITAKIDDKIRVAWPDKMQTIYDLIRFGRINGNNLYALHTSSADKNTMCRERWKNGVKKYEQNGNNSVERCRQKVWKKKERKTKTRSSFVCHSVQIVFWFNRNERICPLHWKERVRFRRNIR